MDTLMELLQDRGRFIGEISAGCNVRKKIENLLGISLCAFAVYGFIMGMSNSFLQSVSSMVKLPLLYLLTTVICFPTFFIFYSLFGSKPTFSKSMAYMLTAICVMSIIMLAFAPVTLFFLLTSKNYTFFKLLNVLFFSVSGIVGVSFFYKMIVTVDSQADAVTMSDAAPGVVPDQTAGAKGPDFVSAPGAAPEPVAGAAVGGQHADPADWRDKFYDMKGPYARRPDSAHNGRNKILFFWLILYAFVGTQLAWTLRPFFGAPDMPFELVRKLGGNFYVDVFKSVSRLFK